MSVQAIEQLPPDTVVEGAVMRRWVDTSADELADRGGVSWATGNDELGTARYAILRRRTQGASPMVLVAYDGAPGLDVLAADDTPDSEIDALLNELEVARLDQEPPPKRPRRRSAAVTVLRFVERNPGHTRDELADALPMEPLMLRFQLQRLRLSGLVSYQRGRWYGARSRSPRKRGRVAAP